MKIIDLEEFLQLPQTKAYCINLLDRYIRIYQPEEDTETSLKKCMNQSIKHYEQLVNKGELTKRKRKKHRGKS